MRKNNKNYRKRKTRHIVPARTHFGIPTPPRDHACHIRSLSMVTSSVFTQNFFLHPSIVQVLKPIIEPLNTTLQVPPGSQKHLPPPDTLQESTKTLPKNLKRDVKEMK